jgi:hypothetical protein
MNGKQSYSPSEFLESLKRNELKQPTALRGMVKAADDDPKSLMFVPGTACRSWTKIPLALIDSIQFVRNVPCKDHTHPLVVLHLAEPKTDEGEMMLSLLQAFVSTEKPRRPGRVVRGPRASGAAGADASVRTHGSWCDTIPEYDVDIDGNIWCLVYCWESEQMAVFNPC